jgi:hypothetical protein
MVRVNRSRGYFCNVFCVGKAGLEPARLSTIDPESYSELLNTLYMAIVLIMLRIRPYMGAKKPDILILFILFARNYSRSRPTWSGEKSGVALIEHWFYN